MSSVLFTETSNIALQHSQLQLHELQSMSKVKLTSRKMTPSARNVKDSSDNVAPLSQTGSSVHNLMLTSSFRSFQVTSVSRGGTSGLTALPPGGRGLVLALQGSVAQTPMRICDLKTKRIQGWIMEPLPV